MENMIALYNSNVPFDTDRGFRFVDFIWLFVEDRTHHSILSFNNACWSIFLQKLSESPENKNVVFLKVDVDDAEVSVCLFKKCLTFN